MRFLQAVKKVYSNWFVFFVLLILAFSSRLFLDPTQPLKFIFLATFCFLGNIWILKTKQRLEFSKRSLLFFLFYLLFIGINVVSALFVSNPITVVYEVLKLILYLNSILIAFLYFWQDTPARLRSLSYAISIFQYIALIALSLSLYSNLTLDYEYIGKTYGGLFINPNLTSQILLLSIPMVIIGLDKEKSTKVYYAQLIGIALSFLGIWFLDSKTAWLSGAIAVGVSFWIYQYFVVKRNKKKMFGIALLVTGCALILSWQNIEKIKSLHSSTHRLELWSRTIPMIKENPLFGSGIGNWKIDNLKYVPWEEIENGSYSDLDLYTPKGNIFYERPHNDFLWVLSELGVIGCSIYLFLFLYLFFQLLKTIKRTSKKDQIHRILLLSGLISYFLIAQSSFPKERIEQSLLFAMISSLILLESDSSRFTSISTKTIYPLLLICLVSIGIGAVRANSEYHMRIVKQSKIDSKWQNVLYHVHLLENRFYPYASDGQPVDLYKGIAEMHLGKTEKARESFLKAKVLNPHQLFVLSNLGTIHSINGNNDSANYYYHQALKINPKFEDARMNLVAIDFNANRLEAAWEGIQQISIHSSHHQFRFFLTTILSAKFENELIIKASQDFELDTINQYLASKKFLLHDLYKKSMIEKTSLEKEFLEGLQRFVLKRSKNLK